MTCLNCEHSKFVNDIKGEANLTCLKYKRKVFADDKCHFTKKYKEEKRVIDIYLKNYKVKSN